MKIKDIIKNITLVPGDIFNLKKKEYYRRRKIFVNEKYFMQDI